MFPDLYKSLLSSMRPLMALDQSEMTLAKSLTKSRRQRKQQPSQAASTQNGTSDINGTSKLERNGNGYAAEDL